MGNISSIHDTFIRAIMADRRIALDYFQASLPASVHGKLDFSTLAQLPDTYVSAELRKTVSDIVYSCQRKDSTGEVKVSLLIEHKSYVDNRFFSFLHKQTTRLMRKAQKGTIVCGGQDKAHLAKVSKARPHRCGKPCGPSIVALHGWPSDQENNKQLGIARKKVYSFIDKALAHGPALDDLSGSGLIGDDVKAECLPWPGTTDEKTLGFRP